MIRIVRVLVFSGRKFLDSLKTNLCEITHQGCILQSRMKVGGSKDDRRRSDTVVVATMPTQDGRTLTFDFVRTV